MRFTKMHGLGNDFIIIDDSVALSDISSFARDICHRHTGIGADGLIIVGREGEERISMRIFNADGSEAQMCGNGIRCAAKYAFERSIVKGGEFDVSTLAGIMRPRVILDGNGVSQITVFMGMPNFEPSDIPTLIENPKSFNIRAFDREFTAGAVLMGVPHLVVFLDEYDDTFVKHYGAALGENKLFPEYINVNFVRIIDRDRIAVRTFERGCGITMACGTGCCASAVVSHTLGLTGSCVKADIELGTLNIECEGEVYMTGPATEVFEGEIKEKDYALYL